MAFEQRDLIALAFAGDTVAPPDHALHRATANQGAFERFRDTEKRPADVPREADYTVPGCVWVLRLIQERLLTVELLDRFLGR
jgi:hypothetical protein